MALRIEDYALIGDTQSVALVGRDGSIDWMCLPRFDSPACFAALLGTHRHGRWLLAPAVELTAPTERRYRAGTLVLETTFTTAHGKVRVVDAMPPRTRTPEVVRIVEGIQGDVPIGLELVIRFDYGSVVPWVTRLEDGRIRAIAGADALVLQTPVQTHGHDLTTLAQFSVKAGQRLAFMLSWHPSHEPPAESCDPLGLVADTEAWWGKWSGRCQYRGPWRAAVLSSLVVLKALSFAPTGGMVAAATTSLPEWPGGVRNWDYRYCWLRDATFTLYALSLAGYHEEAVAWRDWLLRAVAGDPAKLQIMYGLSGERRLAEYELEWLPGYEGSQPVRVGNAAVKQLQLDVYGEVLDALYQTQRVRHDVEPVAWRLQSALLDYLEGAWAQPDHSWWEVRGPRQMFTHSKIMAWVAFDRAVKTVRHLNVQGPAERWEKLRDRIHADICARAWNQDKKAFTQAYGSPHLDAGLLLIPQVGFLPATDARVVGTVAAIERELLRDGLVRRYLTQEQDGLPPGEGVFLACSFWLADCYAVSGRSADARELFERLLGLRNDVGLLAEEYDVGHQRQLGNFPQAFSHVGLINTAFNLTPSHPQPASERQRE